MKIFIQRVLALILFFRMPKRNGIDKDIHICLTRARKGGDEIAKMNHRLWLSAPNTLTSCKFIVYDLPEWKVQRGYVCE